MKKTVEMQKKVKLQKKVRKVETVESYACSNCSERCIAAGSAYARSDIDFSLTN